jgi:hypothetical protein
MQKEINAPCSDCFQKTRHTILHEKIGTKEYGDEVWREDSYCLLECGGCGRISMAHFWRWSETPEDFEERYYPPPVSRKPPQWLKKWLADADSDEGPTGTRRFMGGLLQEIYEALHGGQVRLAAMGTRAFLEQLMISKIGDQGSFAKNLDAFEKGGYISLVQRDAMEEILNAGHAVMHRRHTPNSEDLNTALDIVEGIFAAINIHGDAAARLGERVPKRTTTAKNNRQSGHQS